MRWPHGRLCMTSTRVRLGSIAESNETTVIVPFIRRHNRRALDRSEALAGSPCRKALAHNLDRSAAAHNLDRNAFARSREPHHGMAHRLAQKPRGTDR
jgi:hypothetical protein